MTRALGGAFKSDVSVNGSPSFIIASRRSLLGAGAVSTTGTVRASAPGGRGIPLDPVKDSVLDGTKKSAVKSRTSE